MVLAGECLFFRNFIRTVINGCRIMVKVDWDHVLMVRYASSSSEAALSDGGHGDMDRITLLLNGGNLSSDPLNSSFLFISLVNEGMKMEVE